MIEQSQVRCPGRVRLADSYLPVNQAVHEAKLLDHRGRDNEWVEVVFTHGATDAVDRKHEGKPRFEQLLDAIRAVRIELYRRRVVARSTTGRTDMPDAATISSVSTMCR